MSKFNPQDQFIRGFQRVAQITGITRRQACLKAGVHDATLRRFMNHETDIKLMTLHMICQDGFGVSFGTVYAMGEPE
jgi:hypothetical protein